MVIKYFRNFNFVCFFSIFLCFISLNANAISAKNELEKRLSKYSSFSASFLQQVQDMNGSTIVKGSGTIQIKKPSLFKLNTYKPDPNTLISDGRNVWYYDPFVQQVTVQTFKRVQSSTPLALLTQNNPKTWDEYIIKSNGNSFNIIPKRKGQITEMSITINKLGAIQKFSFKSKNGQTTEYSFYKFKEANFSYNNFKFKLPKNTNLVDRR
ncbi:outer membrane lipoprotein carrier protein LolA [Paraphotobacterium marinum]|uniref:Outer-membrane lipoprotein carrier protein n=1 Tax=Paraphotobacterium marinum TaxID=1755811 RepID=A0A220VBM2_9GAMM|nr:outer membrane lipoprotein chaperone LolA [Paraphotobacterium marinum]ASK77680.1 outer membrane lipoprotein carrier protein LolA [Paraphotobacterium marinum]